MRILEDKNNTIIEGVKDFDLAQTLECGQCFRFYKQNEEDYVLVAYKRLLHIKQKKDKLIFFDCARKTVEELWMPYFDLERDYREIKNYLLRKDHILKDAINEKYGVRILNQEFHEMLISFIISQNKQIPQIKQLVRRISERYGTYLGEINGEEYYSFPDVKILGTISEQDFREMKTGFRAPYLYDAAQKLSNGEISEALLHGLSEEDTRQKLMEIKGVGEKVANCIMLFSLGFRAAFPIDVWIKRIMETLYFQGEDTSKDRIKEFALNLYGEYGGYAQQYLFCYGRDSKIGTEKS
ncbi:MAG: DNA-3-methyladenine glycosylase family protein [Eubacterium sp.]